MGSGGGGRPQTITNVTQQPEYLSQFMQQLQPYFGQVGTGNLTPRIPEGTPLQAPIHPLVNYGNMQQLGALTSPDQGQYYQQARGAINTLFGGMNNPMLTLGQSLMPNIQNSLTQLMSTAPGGAYGYSGGGAGAPGGGGTSVPREYNESPYIQQLIDAQSDDMIRAFQRNEMRDIRNRAVAAGQLGSTRQGVAEGIAQDSLQRALLTNSGQVRQGAYESEMERINRLSIAEVGAAAQMGAASQSANAAMYGARLNGMLNAAQLGYNMLDHGYNTGLQSLTSGLTFGPGVMQYPVQLGQQITGIGGGYQQYNQQNLDEYLRRYMYNGGTTLSDLTALGGIINGTNPGAFGSHTQTSMSPGVNPWMATTGGALAGAAAGARIGESAGPYGAAIGGILGAMGGYFGSRG